MHILRLATIKQPQIHGAERDLNGLPQVKHAPIQAERTGVATTDDASVASRDGTRSFGRRMQARHADTTVEAIEQRAKHRLRLAREHRPLLVDHLDRLPTHKGLTLAGTGIIGKDVTKVCHVHTPQTSSSQIGHAE